MKNLVLLAVAIILYHIFLVVMLNLYNKCVTNLINIKSIP